MRLNKFDLNLLLALDALLRERSVTRAAERLYVSQPAMSAALAKLRDYFNDPLLVRVGRDLELTPRGRSLREPVHQMLLNAQTVLGSQTAFDAATERRTFTLLSPDYISPWVIPAVLSRLEKWAPGVRIQVERPSTSGFAGLAQGDVDLLLAIDAPDSLSLPTLPESMCSAFVVGLRYVCLISADHPEVKGELTSEQFLRLPHIVVRHTQNHSLLEDTVQDNFDMQLDVRAVTENVLELPYLVQGTPFLAVTMEPLARPLRQSKTLRVLEIPEGIMPTSRLDMMWHRSFQPDPSHAWMRGIILNECAGRPVKDIDIW